MRARAQGAETQHRPGVLQPAAHICFTLGQLTFLGGGGGCIVLLCCVLLLLFLPVVYCFLYLYDSFLLMFLFIFGMYVLFSCIILLLEFNVNKIHETKHNSVYKNKLKQIAIQQN